MRLHAWVFAHLWIGPCTIIGEPSLRYTNVLMDHLILWSRLDTFYLPQWFQCTRNPVLLYANKCSLISTSIEILVLQKEGNTLHPDALAKHQDQSSTLLPTAFLTTSIAQKNFLGNIILKPFYEKAIIKMKLPFLKKLRVYVELEGEERQFTLDDK